MEWQRDGLFRGAGGLKAEFDQAAQGFVAVRKASRIPKIFDCFVGGLRDQQGNPNVKRLTHGFLWLQTGFDTTHSATIGIMGQA